MPTKLFERITLHAVLDAYDRLVFGLFFFLLLLLLLHVKKHRQNLGRKVGRAESGRGNLRIQYKKNITTVDKEETSKSMIFYLIF